MLNTTHDATARSWLDSANRSDTDFPVQNLPHGVFSHGGDAPRGGVAIGDRVFDLQAAIALGLFNMEQREIAAAAAQPSLNHFMAMGPAAAAVLRARLFELLEAGSGQTLQAKQDELLLPMSAVHMQVPVHSRSFTDFCTSVPHVAAERRARPARPLPPAMKHLPIAYGGRASSIVVDGTPVPRPYGHGLDEVSNEVYFAPSKRLDFELEFGAYLGGSNALGSSMSLATADENIFGYVLVNDWSARDIQRFESFLGPFLGKSFGTTVSPWVVTQAALEPFRCAPAPRAAGDPTLKPHLTNTAHEQHGALNIQLEAWLSTASMRERGMPAMRITATNLLHLYWTLPQMAAHHASNGCNLETGDLLASGTVSGPEEHQAACLWEITGGSLPLELPTGERRIWLEDGDEINLRGRAAQPGYASIGFGECRGRIAAARAPV